MNKGRLCYETGTFQKKGADFKKIPMLPQNVEPEGKFLDFSI
jgi:hypothetical protein